MRAAVFHGPHDVRIENVPDPAAPAPDEVVLEVTRAAICGTDAAEWDHGPVLCRPGRRPRARVRRACRRARRRRHRPCASATASSRVRESRAVAVGGACAGRTNLCAEYRTLGLQVDGGLAEYVTSPAAICHPVPDACGDDAAAMTQPLAVALHALSRVSAGTGRRRCGDRRRRHRLVHRGGRCAAGGRRSCGRDRHRRRAARHGTRARRRRDGQRDGPGSRRAAARAHRRRRVRHRDRGHGHSRTLQPRRSQARAAEAECSSSACTAPRGRSTSPR